MERRRGRRYPPEIRQRVGAAATRRRREGASWELIGRELGIPHETVLRLAAVVGGEEVGAFKRVEVSVGSSSTASLSLTTPSGHRVDGLDVDGVAELLRRLA